MCISLSGRKWAWQITASFLENQTFPHDLLHVVVLDTSQDETFTEKTRDWFARSTYKHVTYLTDDVGQKGLADLPRNLVRQEVSDACVKIYNRFREYALTPIVFFLEDDILPPFDACRHLISHFEQDVVSVASVCKHRSEIEGKHPYIIWDWTADGTPVFVETQQGVTAVGGNGFCCTAVKGEYLRSVEFRNGPGSRCFDHNFYDKAVRQDGLRALVDWDCPSRHFLNEYTWA